MDEDVFVPEDAVEGDNGLLAVALIIGLREDMAALSRTLKTIHVDPFLFKSDLYKLIMNIFLQNCKGTLQHIESRRSQNQEESQFEVIIKLNISRENLTSMLKLMKQSSSLTRVTVASASNPVAEMPGIMI